MLSGSHFFQHRRANADDSGEEEATDRGYVRSPHSQQPSAERSTANRRRKNIIQRVIPQQRINSTYVR